MTNREQSVLDDIDALVDEQLAGYHERSGYDYNVGQDRCPHCDREWHGLAITDRIEQMRRNGVMDPDYRYADDDSPVLCLGSEFIGPVASHRQLAQIRMSSTRGWGCGLADLLTMPVWSNPFLPEEIPVYPPTQRRRVSRPELPFRPNWWYDHGEISGAEDAVTWDRPWLNAPDINDGDRVAVVIGRRRYEGIAAVSEPAVDPNRPWLIEQHVQLTDVREVSNEIRGFTTGPVIFDETHVFDDEDFRRAVETPQQRALPRPAAQPPMWANDPARTHRTRNRARNVRTPRV